MKALIVICVIVLLLQLTTFGVSFSGGDGDNAPNDSSVKNGDWKPKLPLASRVERLYDPYRPRITLPWDEKSFPALAVEPVPFGNDDDARMVKFELTGGGGVMIRYECRDAAADCPRIVCLCPAGAAVLPQDFAACGFAKPRDNRCAADGNVSTITVDAQPTTLVFSGLGLAGGTVRQR